MNVRSNRGQRSAVDAVVIGGSAGALDVLLRILERLPSRFGVPVIAVMHMSDDPPASLVHVLSTRSALPVREPEDKDPLEGGVVFVAAPGYHMLVDGGPCFAFSLDPPERFSRPSIDVLFGSAADVYGARLAGVVLSGANDDGAQGLAAIGGAGGYQLVQAPGEATSPEMPRAALLACPGAEALPAGAIAERLVELVGEAKARNG